MAALCGFPLDLPRCHLFLTVTRGNLSQKGGGSNSNRKVEVMCVLKIEKCDSAEKTGSEKSRAERRIHQTIMCLNSNLTAHRILGALEESSYVIGKSCQGLFPSPRLGGKRLQ